MMPLAACLLPCSSLLPGRRAELPSAREPSRLTPFRQQLRLPAPQLQTALRTDVMRRQAELMLLGWAGRAYLAAPFAVERIAPSLFQLQAYNQSAAACFERPGKVDCTLREASVGGVKGIPFRLELETKNTAQTVVAARLLSIGCDLSREDAAVATHENGMDRMDNSRVCELVEIINSDKAVKRLIVEAITRAIFGRLPRVADAAAQRIPLCSCTPAPIEFSPRQEIYALEGSSYKWVQQVSGYYFAAAQIQDVAFESLVKDVRFTFYFDPSEPFNSEDPTRNINPEVINCVFDYASE
ncbi:MAG: hypothetical protein SGPRY_004725 [Prymnesium sp.]